MDQKPEKLPGIKNLGRYQVQGELGRGAMGVVYRATDPVIGRTLAVKALAIPSGLEEQDRAEYLERFVREARAAGQLSHPGIVTVYDAGQDEASGLSFLAMEYVPGRTLHDRLAGAGPLPEAEALRIVRELAEALHYAHQRGIVHRDLKPANVLLGEDGSTKITDFGIARVESSELTREGQAIGSPAYMSPEQVLGRGVDRRSDLFSLGVLLYQMLAGERPFPAKELSAAIYQVVHEQPQPLGARNPSVRAGTVAVVDRLLAKRADDRYPDAAALLIDLRALERGDEPAHARVAPPPAAPADRTELDAPPSQTPPPAPHFKNRDSHHFPPAVPGGAATPPPAAREGPSAGGQAVRKAAGALGIALAATGRVLGRVARLGGRGIVLAARSRIWRSRGALAVLAIAAGVLAIWWAAGLLFGGSLPVNVEFKHGLDRGRLRIEVDGSEVVDRSFKGHKKGGFKLFGKEIGDEQGGSFTDSFHVRPGEHEFLIEVDGKGNSGSWSKRVTRTIRQNTETTLEISVERGIRGGIDLDWDSSKLRDD